MDFSHYSGALCAGCIFACSSIVHATEQLSLVALYGAPVGVNKNELGACKGNIAALVSSLQETALLENQELSVESLNSGKILLHYEDFMQAMWCQDGEMQIVIE